MKRLDGLWSAVVAPENLWSAYRKARRGHARSHEVARFTLELEGELPALRDALDSGRYQPGDYHQFTVYERKPRLVSAAPFRDRVVQHAVMNVIETPLDRRFIYDSYACCKGKGTHAAVNRYQQWARRYAYALKLDVAAYFPSIDHERLKEKLRLRIADGRTLALLDLIIDQSPPSPPGVFAYAPGDDLLAPLGRRRGLPIGNLTSQFFANLYLDELDHFVKERLRARAYLRYVDDMVVLGDDKTRLREIRNAISDCLARDRLKLRPRKVQLVATRAGLELLGYRVFPGYRRLRSDNAHRFSRRLKGMARAYAAGRCTQRDVAPSIQGWIAHASHADSEGLRRAILAGTVFQRGRDST